MAGVNAKSLVIYAPASARQQRLWLVLSHDFLSVLESRCCSPVNLVVAEPNFSSMSSTPFIDNSYKHTESPAPALHMSFT